MAWKLKAKKTLLNTYKSSVQAWTMTVPNGQTRDFFITAGYSFVVVLAIDTRGRVIILKQFYINQQKKIFSLVAGIIDDKESVKTTAKRELLEETGYTAKRFVALGKSIKGKYTTGYVYPFLALDASQVQEPNLEPAEDIQVLAVSMAEFKKMLAQHKFLDLSVEVCSFRALAYLDKLKNSKK